MQQTAVVTSAGLNLRERPGEHTAVLHKLTRGERLPVIERKTFHGKYEWVKVRVGHRIGWVYSEYVRIEHHYVPPQKPAPLPETDFDFGYLALVVGGFAAVFLLLLWAFN